MAFLSDRFRRPTLPALLALAALASASPARAERPRVFALTGGRLLLAPGQTIEGGTVVLRDGLIEAVGKDVRPPADAVVVDVTGKTVHAGFLDACSAAGLKSDGGEGGSEGGGNAPAPRGGIAHPVGRIHPELRAVDLLDPPERDFEKRRALGFTAAAVFPPKGIFRGAGALVSLGERPLPSSVIRPELAQIVGFDHGEWNDPYPDSLMGAVAAIRQGFEDARRHAVWQARWDADPRGMPRPDTVSAWEPLTRAASGKIPVVFDARSVGDVLRADALADAYGLQAAIVGSGFDAEALDAVRATGRTLILSLAFPEKPELSDADDTLEIETRQLERFLLARSNAARLAGAGVPIAFGTCRMKSLTDVPANLRRAIDAGLPFDLALAALTTVPARIYGVDRSLGTIEPGKAASIVVEDGVLFAEKTKPVLVYVDGDEYRVEERAPRGDPNAVVDPRGSWSVTLSFGEGSVTRVWTIAGAPGAWTGTAETRAGTVPFASVRLEGNALTVSLSVAGGERSEATVIVTGDSFEGTGETSGGETFSVRGTRTGPAAATRP